MELDDDRAGGSLVSIQRRQLQSPLDRLEALLLAQRIEERIPLEVASSGDAHDPVVKAAIRWLLNRPKLGSMSSDLK